MRVLRELRRIPPSQPVVHLRAVERRHRASRRAAGKVADGGERPRSSARGAGSAALPPQPASSARAASPCRAPHWNPGSPGPGRPAFLPQSTLSGLRDRSSARLPMRRAAVRRFSERAHLRQRIALDVVRKLPNFPDKRACAASSPTSEASLRRSPTSRSDSPAICGSVLAVSLTLSSESRQAVDLRSQPVIGAIVRGSLAVAVSRFEAIFSATQRRPDALAILGREDRVDRRH